jgi:methylmalonyl-CoA/ethylmalonyl-CoA epimerase
MKLDHIGIVVKSLEKSRMYYKNFFNFTPVSKIIIEPAHKVKLQFLETGFKTKGPLIELISPLGKKSKVYNFLEKNGDSFHHFAYFVNNILTSIAELQKKGSVVISDIVPGAGHKKTNTIWLLTPDRSIIELIEKKKKISFFNRLT